MSWLNGTTILLTGATGFVGKVVLVKLLSEVPHIGKIYVLFRKKEGSASLKQRFDKEIISSKAFDALRIRYAKGFQKFIEKIEPVIGELGEEQIFEDVTVAKKISESVHFVINAASNVNFRWRVDTMLRANANGVTNLVKFAKTCSQLKGFIHVSSVAALMTKDKTGEIKEELLEETLVGGLDKELLEVNNEIASIKAKYSLDDNTKLFEELTDLGLERAQEHGFPDTYHYTKALGELIVTKMRGNWPVIIVRPSVIESCFKSPFPGFIEGFKGSEPIFLAYGTGNLKAFPHNESFTWDCMPADILANVCILSTKYALEKKPDIKVFHVCSGMENPLSLRDLKAITFKYFQDKPMKHPVTKKVIKLEEPLQNCSMQEFLQMSEKDKVLKSLLKLTPYVGNQVQQQIFRTDNLQELRRMINKEEAEKFFIAIKNISWESYLYQHIDTCRQLLKGNISNFMLRSKL